MYPRWLKAKCCNRYVVALALLTSLMVVIYIKSFPNLVFPAQHPSTLEEADITHAQQRSVIIPKAPKKVVYKDFSHCPPRPPYLKEYKAHCWLTCKAGVQCNATFTDFSKGRAKRHCFPNLHLVGVRKCGTQDLTKWFASHDSVSKTLQDYLPSGNCPVDDLAARMNPRPHENQHGFNDGPGSLLEQRIFHSNDTHMEVVTPLQLLGYMATPDTKFYVQLRNPSDRTISYLFHWLKKGYMWKKIPLKNVTEEMVHNLLEPLVSSFHECVAKEGELACVYKYSGNARRESRVPENLLRHSLYVVYLEESFQFVPARQFQFRTIDEYSLDQVGTVKSLMSFFGLTFQESKIDLQEEIRNVGRKKPVWNKTIDMLDNFFKPYNERLAKLLNNDKWLFKRKS